MTDCCPNCGSRQRIDELRAPAFDAIDGALTDSYQLSRCCGCQLVSTRGVTEELLDSVYTAEYFGNGAEKFHAAIEILLLLGARRRARVILGQWQRLKTVTSPRVLDVGCGRGLLLKGFKEAGATIRGLERSLEPVDESMREVVKLGELGGFVASGETFDVVIFWHVLEHIASPDRALEEVAALMRPDGLLVLAVPNFGSFQRRLFGKHWFHLDLPRHVVHFETEWLESRLLREGYQIERKTYFEPAQSVFGFVQSAMNFLAPRRRNRFYDLLKSSHPRSLMERGEKLLWIFLAIILLPIALLDTLLGCTVGGGATVSLRARFVGRHHDQ